MSPAVAGVLAVAACASAPRGPAPDLLPPGDHTTADKRAAVARIELCRTTDRQLEAAFGAPTRDGRLGRYRLVTWMVDTLKFGDTTLPRSLIALVEPATSVVVDLSWDAPVLDMTWIPRDQCR